MAIETCRACSLDIMQVAEFVGPIRLPPGRKYVDSTPRELMRSTQMNLACSLDEKLAVECKFACLQQ